MIAQRLLLDRIRARAEQAERCARREHDRVFFVEHDQRLATRFEHRSQLNETELARLIAPPRSAGAG